MTSYTITTTVNTPIYYLNEGDNLTLTSTGTITVGSSIAVDVFNDLGTLTNNGLIDGYCGVVVFGSISSLTNNGVIIGNSSRGVEANFAIGTLTNSGLIEGFQQGIADLGDLTSFDNSASGTISGGTGLYFYGSTGTLVNSGLIEGSFGYGVNSSQGFNDFDNSGIISCTQQSALYSAGNIGTLTNEGTIGGYDGLEAGGSISVLSNSGSITGESTALSAYGIGTLTNSGLIDGNDLAIFDGGSLTSLDNMAGGIITGHTAINAEGGIGTLSNSGIIHGSGSGIFAPGAIGTLTNTGSISGYIAINAGAIGTLTNGGTISGGVYAIGAGSGGLTSFDNDATGALVNASQTAIRVNGDIGTLTNAGTITGGITAVNSEGSIGTLTNDGELYGGSEAIFVGSGTLGNLVNETLGTISGGGPAIEVDGTIGTLTNDGTITAYYTAIVDRGTIGTLTNDGTIGATGILAYGIYSSSGITDLDNSGSISGASEAGVYAGGDIGTLTNEGTISGGDLSAAVYSAGTIGLLSNSGTLISAGGTPIIVDAIGTLDNSGSIGGFVRVNGDVTILDNKTDGSINGLVVGGTIDTLMNDGTLVGGGDYIEAGAIGTLTNSGNIDGGGVASGTLIQDYGNLTDLDNKLGATISCNSGIALFVDGTVGTLTNEGFIGSSFVGVIDVLGDIDDFHNSGTISGGSYTAAAIISRGTIEILTNEGSILSQAAGISASAAGTIINSGTISASGDAISVGGTIASLNNQTGGLISGNSTGIQVSGTLGMLTNEGTITGGGGMSSGGGGSSSAADNGIVSIIGTLSNVGWITPDGNATNGGSDGVSAAGITALSNSGIISANGDGVAASGAIGTLTNSGTINANGTAISVGSSLGTLSNAGTIDGGSTGIFASSVGTIENAGTISGGTDAIYASSPGGTLILDPTSVINGNVVFNDGTLEVAGSTSNFVSGIGSQYTGFTAIAFDNADAEVQGNVSGLASGEVITGFSTGDTIFLQGFSGITESYVAGEGLVLTDPSSNTETLDIAGAYTSANFEVLTLGQTTVIIELCYLRGTRILTPAGEVPVETLQIGDLVVTRQGGFRPVKWIGRQSYDARFVANDAARLPVRIRPGALGEGLPARDLYISPGHSVLVDGTLLLASTLVNGVTITHECPDDMARIEYFQPELDGHDCILAEGAWSETFADGPGLRNAYHNAGEFWAMYPDYRTPDAIHLCAPRPERGAALDAALRPLVARASRGVTQGHLLGSIDRVSGREIDGWAFDAANPHLPVLVEVVVAGEVVHTALACDFRPDLREAGFGLGRCAFFLMLAEEIPAELLHTLHIRRAGDGATLPMSEICRTSYLRAA